jgi:hypothetical protein
MGSYLEFLVNNPILSAERTKIHVTSEIELVALLLRLREYIEQENLEYFEIYVPTTDIKFQKVFSELNFSCFGYIPAWRWANNKLDDCLIFGIYRTPINWQTTKLSDNSESLARVLQPHLKEL